MKGYISNLWNTVSHLGVESNESNLKSRYDILTNQINFLALLIMISLSIFLFLYRDIFEISLSLGDLRVYVIILLTIINMFLAYFGKLNISKISLIFLLPLLLIVMPTVRGFVEVESFFYYPVTVIILSIAPPLILCYDDNPVLYIISIIYFFSLLIFIDSMLMHFAPAGLTEIKTLYGGVFAINKIIHVLIFFFLHFSISYLKKINHKYEKVLKDVNLKLKEKNSILDLKYKELKTSNTKLKNTQQQLVYSEKMASLGVLTAGIAHEINNPLNFIAGGSFIVNDFMEEIKTGTTIDSNMIKYSEQGCDMITKGIDQATSIVSALMTFSYSGKPQKKHEDLNQIIESTLLFQKSRMPTWLSIDKKYALTQPVNIYAEKMHQVVLNLIDNAIFEISKSTGPNEDKYLRIETGYDKTEKKAFVKVSNSGRLIDSVVGSKLFDPFFTTKQPGQGTGLGLSIVSNIVKEHGGEIRFVNLKDGVEFIVTLPAD